MAVDVENVTGVKFPPVLEDFEGWSKKKKILIILAHPDDPEFFMGATLSRWGKLGHEIHYVLLTTGQKGSQDVSQTPAGLTEIRKQEQQNAANALGIKSVQFWDYVDGELMPDLNLRKRLVRLIRQLKPQVVISSDPLNFFPADNRVNHPDHRAAGQAVLDAVYPAVGNPMFFPELISEEGLVPVNVEELWFSIPAHANLVVNVSDYFEDKINAILCHRSQIGMDVEKFKEIMKTRWVTVNEQWQRVYLERFRRIIFSQ